MAELESQRIIVGIMLVQTDRNLHSQNRCKISLPPLLGKINHCSRRNVLSNPYWINMLSSKVQELFLTLMFSQDYFGWRKELHQCKWGYLPTPESVKIPSKPQPNAKSEILSPVITGICFCTPSDVSLPGCKATTCCSCAWHKQSSVWDSHLPDPRRGLPLRSYEKTSGETEFRENSDFKNTLHCKSAVCCLS